MLFLQNLLKILLVSVPFFGNITFAYLTVPRILHDSGVHIDALYHNGQSSRPSYPLNQEVIPMHYYIMLKTYLSENDGHKRFSFEGFVNISLQALSPDVNQIALHVSADLRVDSLALQYKGNFFSNESFTNLLFDEKSDKLFINLNKKLIGRKTYYLSINYTSRMNDHGVGFYKRSYHNKYGDIVWIGATENGLNHTHLIFPCFDEPIFPAVFSLEVDRNADYFAVSNARLLSSNPLKDNRFLDTFHSTPLAPAHYFVLAVSNFDIRHDYNIEKSSSTDLQLHLKTSFGLLNFRKIFQYKLQNKNYLYMLSSSMKMKGIHGLENFFDSSNLFKMRQNYTANSSSDYRLSDRITPLTYDILLTPYFNEAETPKRFTFDGLVSIKLMTTYLNIKQITLHASKNLNIKDVTLLFSNSSVDIVDSVYEPWSEKLYINLNNPLVSFWHYVLIIKYTGLMNDKPVGFYKIQLETVGNEKRWIGATNLKYFHARKVFPCFDEPQFKAYFHLKINHSVEYNVKSNTALEFVRDVGNGYVVDCFSVTPFMSTYLLSFVISHHKTWPERKGFYSLFDPKFTIGRNEFALKLTTDFVRIMNHLVSIPFFDSNRINSTGLLALPDAPPSESWGLISLSELELLYDEKKSPTNYEIETIITIANKFIHNWFVNSIKFKWWGDYWIIEGLAAHFQSRLLHFFSRLRKIADIHSFFNMREVQKSLLYESQVHHALSQPNFNAPYEIDELLAKEGFGKILTVMQMIKHILGEHDFESAILNFMYHHLHDAITPNLLSKIFDLHYHDRKINLKKFINDWTQQTDYPLVKIDFNRKNRSVQITSESFHLDDAAFPNLGKNQAKKKWIIPIYYMTNIEKKFISRPKTYLGSDENPESLFFLVEHGTTWIIGNPLHYGFYRVTYADENWKTLEVLLKSKHFGKITRLTRAQIIDDALNLARASKLDYQTVFNMMEYLLKEDDYYPWYATFQGLSYISDRMAGHSDEKYFTEYMRALLKDPYGRVYNTSMKEDHLDLLHRSQLMYWACRYEIESCLEEAKEFYKYHLTKRIPKDMEFSVYCSIMRQGNELAVIDNFFNKYKRESFPARKRIIIESIGCVKNATLVRAVLVDILKSNILGKNKLTLLDALFEHNLSNRGMLWNYIIKFRDSIREEFRNIITLDAMLCKYSKYINNFTLLRTIPLDVYLISDHSFINLAKCIDQQKLNEKWINNLLPKVINYMQPLDEPLHESESNVLVLFGVFLWNNKSWISVASLAIIITTIKTLIYKWYRKWLWLSSIILIIVFCIIGIGVTEFYPQTVRGLLAHVKTQIYRSIIGIFRILRTR